MGPLLARLPSLGTMPDDTSRTVFLLDVDGTLVDSTYHHALAWHRALRAHDVSVPLWRVHRTIGMGGDKLVTEVAGEDVEERCGDQLRERWEEEYAAVVEEVPPLTGASDLVRDLCRQGHTVVLASSGAERFTEQAVEVLGVRDEIAATTSSDDAEESKPDPEILSVALERSGAGEGARAVAVGDTPYDVEAAARIGLACVGLLSGGYSRAELEEAGAVDVVEVPADLVGRDWEPLLREPEVEVRDAGRRR